MYTETKRVGTGNSGVCIGQYSTVFQTLGPIPSISTALDGSRELNAVNISKTLKGTWSMFMYDDIHGVSLNSERGK